MNKHPVSPEQLFAEEQRLSANCFTLKHYGPVVEGIELSFDQGPHQNNPWPPHVNVGGWRVGHDIFNGCAYKVQPGGRGTIRRAALLTRLNKGNGKEFFTLVRPEMEKPGFSLIKVDLRLLGVKDSVIAVKGRPLDLYTGSSGGRVVEGENYEALIELKEGEKLTLFFPDGAVRRFIREGYPVERKLTLEDQLKARIAQAWSMLEEQTSLPGDLRPKAVMWTLRGMVDLVNLTKVFDSKGEGQELRIMLMREFFLELAPEVYELCERNLVAALYQVDPALVEVARGTAPLQALPEGVTDLDQVRRAQEKAKLEAQRRARQLERSQQGPAKGPSNGGKKGQQASNPKVIAKRQRKEAQRKVR